ncbi:MAG: oxygenase MpaB family protein [Chthoniobacterales bacterium]
MSAFEPFTPDSMMWKINRERIVLLGGASAAVLQVAHPQVAMGVAAHSKFRSDSTGRLRRTLDAVYAVAFGSAEEVDRVRGVVARAHAPVQGKSPAPYSAFDPDAQLWVLATLIMASTNMFRRFVGPLTEKELNQFLEENARFGEVFGLSPELLPRTWPEFKDYWQSMIEGSLLGSHPLCGEVARAVIRPDAPWTMRALSPIFRELSLEYIPGSLRERLGFPAPSSQSRSWKALDHTLPWLRRMAPPSLRYATQYHFARGQLDRATDVS